MENSSGNVGLDSGAFLLTTIVYQALNPRPSPLFSSTKVGTPYESLGMIEAKVLLDTRV